jgi:polysaccharide biosynthesis protein PslH
MPDTMRILFLSQVVPFPPDAGPKVRIYHVLQYLARAGHEITLVAFRRQGDSSESIAHLGTICHEVHTILMKRSRLKDAWCLARSLLTARPFLIDRDSVTAMHRLLKRLMAQQAFDAIHADQLWMAQYALVAAKIHSVDSSPTTILDQHNAVYRIPERMVNDAKNPLMRAFLRWESRKLARYEIGVCRRFDHVVWVTDEDRQALAAATNGQQSDLAGHTIPITVDPEDKPIIARAESARRVTFMGGLHWPPNASGVIWFINEVWPSIHEAMPEAILTIIGKDPPATLTAQAGLSNVEVTGYIPDPLPYLAETAVFIVPLHSGGGMRVKILDAWSWGLPVVSTTIGAEGLHYRDEENLLVADEPARFSLAVQRLLSESDLADRLTMAGRQTIERCYDWRQVYQAWDQIYSR